MRTITFNKNEEIKLHDRQFIFLSDGTRALHLYKEDLKEDFPCVKTWGDLLTYLAPKIINLYVAGYCQQIIII